MEKMDIDSTNLNVESPSKISPTLSLGTCFILTFIYISSLYIWGHHHNRNRNHPSTVKKRFFSVTIVMIVSSVIVYLITPAEVTNEAPIWQILGFRSKGLLTAVTMPLLLTIILFLGPVATQIQSGTWRLYLKPRYWLNNFQNILWIRNHIMAPLSEEFTFRACMLPLLLYSFRPMTAVLITSLFFGIGHLHHIVDRMQSGMDKKTALIISFSQFCYTTIFGTYSAYLFARTGHFAAPFVAHAFCNHMGFPDIQEVLKMPAPGRQILIAVYFVGFLSWIILLPVLTEPIWYSNTLYWNT